MTDHTRTDKASTPHNRGALERLERDYKDRPDPSRADNGHLLQTYERERMRIARELHDGFTQRLVMMSVELNAIAAEAQSSIVHERIVNLYHQVATLGADLERMSHELHPVILLRVGLQAAIQVYCDELSARRGLFIQFDSDGPVPGLPHAVELCVYRVVQEALTNVVKHSGASLASIRLWLHQGELVLTVEDTGAGFDIESVSTSASLGLTSMRERVELVSGRFRVEAREGSGTKISVWIPVGKA